MGPVMACARRRPRRHSPVTPSRLRRTRSMSWRIRCASCARCPPSRSSLGRPPEVDEQEGAPRRARERVPQGMGDAQGQRTASESCLRRGSSSNLRSLPPSRDTSIELRGSTCRISLTRSSRARQKARSSPWTRRHVRLRPTLPAWCCLGRPLCYGTRCGQRSLVSYVLSARIQCSGRRT